MCPSKNDCSRRYNSWVLYFLTLVIFLSEKATKQPLTDEKLTTDTTPIVMGFAYRSSLPQRILDFCGSFPIYEVEEVSVEEMNATLFNSEGTKKKL